MSNNPFNYTRVHKHMPPVNIAVKVIGEWVSIFFRKKHPERILYNPLHS